MNQKQLSTSDLETIKTSKSKIVFAKLLSEKASLEERVTNLEYQNILFTIYFKYGLTSEHNIDENTGFISSNEKCQKIDGYGTL